MDGSSSLRPSGIVLPLLLRQKCREEQLQAQAAAAAKGETLPEQDKKIDVSLKAPKSRSSQEARDLPNRMFTAASLETLMAKTRAAMSELQHQIKKGEEQYYDDTAAWGNLHKGWDGLVDLRPDPSGKDDGTEPLSALMPSANQGKSKASRIPQDARWFSSSSNPSQMMVKPYVRPSLTGSSMRKQSPTVDSSAPASASKQSQPTKKASASLASSAGASAPKAPPPAAAPSEKEQDKQQAGEDSSDEDERPLKQLKRTPQADKKAASKSMTKAAPPTQRRRGRKRKNATD